MNEILPKGSKRAMELMLQLEINQNKNSSKVQKRKINLDKR